MQQIATRREFLGRSLLGVGSAVVAQVTNCAAQSIDDDITAVSATRLAELIAKGDFSSQEVVQAHIDRIHEVNPPINAIVQRAFDDAITRARVADMELARGEPLGPLHGVPLTIKDCFETKGIVTTNGIPELKTYVPSKDATVVSRLRKAGGIVIGKTNVPELSYFGVTDNLVYGRTNNPHDVSRSPGGSSGGEAAIIAAGGSPAGIGSDIGGSIRVPSHYCGIAGLKPTSGRVPSTGKLFGFSPLIWNWNAIGPMSRHVDDLQLLLEVIAGPDGLDPSTTPMPLGDPSRVDMAALKVAYFTCDEYSQASEATARAVMDAVNVLKDLGAKASEERPAHLTEALDIWEYRQTPWFNQATRQLFQEYAKLAGTEVADKHHFWMEYAFELVDHERSQGWDKPEKQLGLARAEQSYRERMHRFMNRFDAIICPVENNPAPPHTNEKSLFSIPFEKLIDTVKHTSGDYTTPFNITGWPVAVVRCGTSPEPEELPIGVQIVSKSWREDVVLAIAKQLEQRLGGWKPPKRLVTGGRTRPRVSR